MGSLGNPKTAQPQALVHATQDFWSRTGHAQIGFYCGFNSLGNTGQQWRHTKFRLSVRPESHYNAYTWVPSVTDYREKPCSYHTMRYGDVPEICMYLSIVHIHCRDYHLKQDRGQGVSPLDWQCVCINGEHQTGNHITWLNAQGLTRTLETFSWEDFEEWTDKVFLWCCTRHYTLDI